MSASSRPTTSDGQLPATHLSRLIDEIGLEDSQEILASMLAVLRLFRGARSEWNHWALISVPSALNTNSMAFFSRKSNLICAAAVVESVLVIKTVMHHFEIT